MLVLYRLYDWGRLLVTGSRLTAFNNAIDVMRWERTLHIDFEKGYQQLALRSHVWVSTWNIYYGTVHFIAPVAALILLYRRAPLAYVRWRNTLLFIFAIGVLGFWLYPLMPPRLMPARYGYVDTPAEYYNFGPQQPAEYGPGCLPDDLRCEPSAKTVRNFDDLWAGMPSLHVAWAAFSIIAMLPLIRRLWLKVVVSLHAVGTFFAIYTTGNHRIPDAIAGLLTVALGWLGAAAVARMLALARTPAQRRILETAPSTGN